MACCMCFTSGTCMGQLSVVHYWRLARVYGGTARRNAVDSTGVASMWIIFNWVKIYSMYILTM